VPKVKGFVKGVAPALDFKAGRQMGQSLVTEGLVFGESKGFDIDEDLAERLAESVEGTE
jgi:hypothetical protein